MDQIYCYACGHKNAVTNSTCSSCGADLHPVLSSLKRPVLTTRIWFILVLATVAVWSAAWFIHPSLMGAKPAGTFDSHSNGGSGQGMAQLNQDPEIHALTKTVEANPNDIEAQRALVHALLRQYSATQNPSQELTLDLLEALSAVVRLDPSDKSALLALADLSFDRQVFDKSAELYRRYLELEPNDLAAASRYGSALVFRGQFKEAISVLDGVLKRDPNNFAALAYLSITYAQSGDRGQAISFGEKALTKAPNEEARARFATFLDGVKSGDVKAAPTASQKDQAASIDANANLIADSIKANPVAGPKFVRAEVRDGGKTLWIFMSNFPISAMPEAVRAKFLAGIKSKIGEQSGATVKNGDVTKVVLASQESGEQLAVVE